MSECKHCKKSLDPVYVAKKNTAVISEYELYRDNELMCHLSESDLFHLADDLKFPVSIED